MANTNEVLSNKEISQGPRAARGRPKFTAEQRAAADAKRAERAAQITPEERRAKTREYVRQYRAKKKAETAAAIAAGDEAAEAVRATLDERRAKAREYIRQYRAKKKAEAADAAAADDAAANDDAANAADDDKPRRGRKPRDIPTAEREALAKEMRREAGRRRYVAAMAVFGRQPRAYHRAANAEEAAANRRESQKRYNAKISEMIKAARAMMANLTLAPDAGKTSALPS